MRIRFWTTVAGASVAAGLAVLSACGGEPGSAQQQPSEAASPAVREVTVQHTCPGTDDLLTSTAQMRTTETPGPGGTKLSTLRFDGTLTNESNGRTVEIHGNRRYLEDPATDTGRFSGVWMRYSAPGHGVIWINSGSATGPAGESVQEWSDKRGRWEPAHPPPPELPAEVCEVLTGAE